MIYKLVKIKGETSKIAGNIYARVAHLDEMVSLDELAAHMANHNTPYSKGVIKGVLIDMVSCIRELVLQGKSVKIDDLAIFYATITSKAATTVEEFDAATHITAVKLAARATGAFRKSEIEKDVTWKRLGEYTVD